MDLFSAWISLCRHVGAHGDIAGSGAMLLGAYAGEHRAYHDLHHLTEVLGHVDELAAYAASADIVRMAAWFHDAVYDTSEKAARDNEQRSAELATRTLTALRVDDETVAEVSRLVLATATHDPEPGDGNAAVLCDADLAVLARDPAGYADYVAAIRREYAHVSDGAFRHGRAAVLRGLLEQPTLFRTPLGHERWEAEARANMAAELRQIG